MYGANYLVARPVRSNIRSLYINRRLTKRPSPRSPLIVRATATTAFGVGIPQSLALTSLACTAKAFSFIFTYPFESYKIYTQLGRKPDGISDLYQGFPMFLLLATSQCFLSYNVFFATLEAFKGILPSHLAYLYASTVSCILTSFVKVPMSFISRNIIFTKGFCGIATIQGILSKMNEEVYRNSWMTTVIGDIPDSFIKFFVNDWVQVNAPFINNINRSCITGIITAFVNMPLDYILTQTLCTSKHFGNILSDNFFSKCMMGVHYRMFSCMIGNVIFFSMFNTLQTCFL